MSGNKYKLTYFKARERGEFIRYLFAHANVPYEEINIDLSDWPKEKPSKLQKQKEERHDLLLIYL